MGSFLTLVCQSAFSHFKGRRTDRLSPIPSTVVEEAHGSVRCHVSWVVAEVAVVEGGGGLRVCVCGGGTANPNVLTLVLRSDFGQVFRDFTPSSQLGEGAEQGMEVCSALARVFPKTVRKRLTEETFKWGVGRKQKRARTKSLRQP